MNTKDNLINQVINNTYFAVVETDGYQSKITAPTYIELNEQIETERAQAEFHFCVVSRG